MTAATVTRDSPYVGLVPFEADDRALFFGRDSDIRLIVANLFASPLTLLYGPTGVG
jgi:eukaryotic-like serine/threonine-protein kinase